MDANFCKNVMVHKRIIKCISPVERKNYVFMNIYFLETEFSINDQVTWYSNGKRGLGSVDKIVDDEDSCSIIEGETERKYTIPTYSLNKVHPMHQTIMKMDENIRENDDIFSGIKDKDIEQLYLYLNCTKEEIYDYLFIDGFESIFIYDEIMNEDDTNEMILMKLSHYCCSKVPSQYIYAIYTDNETNQINAIGFNYHGPELMHPDEILSIDICEMINKEKDFTDMYNNNHISPNENYYDLFENNNIKDNTLTFLNLDQYLREKDIKDELLSNDLNCDDISEEIKLFKNRVINKYWPLNRNETIQTVIDNEVIEKKYLEEKNKLMDYSIGNRFIYGEFMNFIKEPRIGCDFFELDYLRIQKKDEKVNTVNLYQLFSNWRLSDNIPFVKWVGATYDNIYFKLHRDSIIYEGYDAFKDKKKTVDINLCDSWMNNLYRDNNLTLYDSLHKTDIIIFKICSTKDQNEYCSLAIHQDGEIEFIIKKDKHDILSISRKESILELFEQCNHLIHDINQLNIYSTYNINTFGDRDELNKLFTNEDIDSKIDFIDYNIYFLTENYEVKDGVTQEEMNQLSQESNYNPNTRPFVNGSKNGFYLPLLKNIMKNLPMFFRYMVENDKEGNGVLSGHYKRVNNYSNRSTIQSAISAYSNIDGLEPEEIINMISKEFSKDPKDITEEYESWEIMMKEKREKGNLRLNVEIEENGPDIMIQEKEEYVQFKIKDSKSFRELERVIIVIKTMMNMIYDYINNNERFNHPLLRSYIEGEKINVEELVLPEEDEDSDDESNEEFTFDALKNAADMSDSEEDSDDDNYLSSDSDSDDDMVGGAGKYEVRSYALKRLKQYDKKLFVFKSDKFQFDKQGKKTNTRYGYAKVCQASKGLGSRQPIAVTKEELDRIDSEEAERLGSGKKSYSRALVVPGREIVDDKEIKYICPQYWDVSKQLSIRPEKVNPEDIIPEVLPKDGRSDQFILKRQGTYWDGIPEEESYKYFVPQIQEDKGIHPDGYGLPCCFSTAYRGDTKVQKKPKGVAEKPKKKKKKKKKDGFIYPSLYNHSNEGTCKINTKASGPLQPGQCSQLPKKLQEILIQDSIFRFDKDLLICKGFIRKGVQQNKGKYLFNESSFINSLIEILEYEKTSEEFIKEEIIEKLEENVTLFQHCPLIHKSFKIDHLSKDDIQYVIQVLEKTQSSYSESKYLFTLNDQQTMLEKLKTSQYPYSILFDTNRQNYIFNLIVTLKTYRDYLFSEEQKEDKYIIPVLNVVLDNPMNIIIYEMINDKIEVKLTDYTQTDKMCFIYKKEHYYEPILYRVHSYLEVSNDDEFDFIPLPMDIKIFEMKYFEEFGHIYNKDSFSDFLKKPYPRGRMNDFRSGTKVSKLVNQSEKKSTKLCDNNDLCKSWFTYDEYLKYSKDKEIKEGLNIKWIVEDSTECKYSGTKEYSLIKEILEEDIITIEDERLNKKDVLYRNKTKTIDPKLIDGLTNSKDWIWIGEGCTDINDKDIEALLRKQLDPKGDKVLLKFSTSGKVNLPKDNEKLISALKSEFFIIRKLINDIQLNIIDQYRDNQFSEQQKVFEPDTIYLNRYSEVCYFINTSDKDDLIIVPIIPCKLPLSHNKDIVFDLQEEGLGNLPSFNTTIKYLSLYQKEINHLSKLDSEIRTIILKDGTYLSIEPFEIDKTSDLYNQYTIIESQINLKDIDDSLYKNNLIQTKDNMIDYIFEYNHKLKYMQLVFSQVIRLISTKKIDISVERHKSVQLNTMIYFTKSEDTITLINEDKYRLMDYTLFSKQGQEIPYCGIVSNIQESRMVITVHLTDKLTHIINDNILTSNDKKERIFTIIYNLKGGSDIPDQLFIRDDEIFKKVSPSELSGKNVEELIQYTLKGRIIKRIMNKNRYQSIILINKDNYDESIIIMKRFINQLLIHVNNGNDLLTMNKSGFDNVKISYIEKITPKTEVFFRYSKDKTKRTKRLQNIFKKKSQFIKDSDRNDLQLDKQRITKKLNKVPYYIKKLYGEDAFISYNIDSVRRYGADWITLTETFKEVNIRNLKYSDPSKNGLPEVISMIINGLELVEYKDEVEGDTKGKKKANEILLNDYNKYERIKNRILENKTVDNYESLGDIKEKWRRRPSRTRIQVPDIPILLSEIEKKYKIDLGIILITYNYQKKIDIHFHHTSKLYQNTPILSFYHTIDPYTTSDYILSNILSNDEIVLTVEELIKINGNHSEWLKHRNGVPLVMRPCNNKTERLRKLNEEKNRIDEEYLQKTNDINDQMNSIESADCED